MFKLRLFQAEVSRISGTSCIPGGRSVLQFLLGGHILINGLNNKIFPSGDSRLGDSAYIKWTQVSFSGDSAKNKVAKKCEVDYCIFNSSLFPSLTPC